MIQIQPTAIKHFIPINERSIVRMLAAESANIDNRPTWLEIFYPLSKNEVLQFLENGLEVVRFEDYLDKEEPPLRRFRIRLKKCT